MPYAYTAILQHVKQPYMQLFIKLKYMHNFLLIE